MGNQMFKNDRYITRGINNTIPVKLQILMWELIGRLEGDNRDYLQVFQLELFMGKNGEVMQKIIHTQEEPLYKKEYYINIHEKPVHKIEGKDTSVLNIDEPINEKIFVIDDTSHSTMLLAEEY